LGSLTPQRLRHARDLTRVTVLPSGLPDTVGASDFGYFGAHIFGIPSLHVPLPNASSSRLPTALTWFGVRMDSLLLSCMTLSFTTSRRFIPTLSRQECLCHHAARSDRGEADCPHMLNSTIRPASRG